MTLIVGLSLVTFGLGFAALYLTAPGGTTAIWWPAAGAGALLALLYRGPRWQVLVLVGAAGASSNALIGKPLDVTLWSALALVIEIAVFMWVLGPQGRSAMLSSRRGLLRFIVAALSASVAVAAIVGMAFVANGASPLPTFAALVPSHLSALLIIVPLALVPLPRRAPGQVAELIVQLALTTGAALLIFLPFQTGPLSSLLFPLFGWAAVRFRPVIPTLELIALGIIVSVMTALGGGPFALVDNALPPERYVQLYLLAMALTIQFITVVRSEHAEIRAANDRRGAILRGGFVGSQVGSMFVRPMPGASPSILEINDVAADLIDQAWLDPLIDAWLVSGTVDLSTDVLIADDRTVQVYGRHVLTADGESVLGLQVVEITDLVAAQQAMADAMARERHVADELRALGQQKDDFVSSVSHELRTPITSILGFAEELRETATPDQQQSADIIVRNAQRLTEMVEQLLEIGRMTAPNPLREARTVDLTMIARDTIQDQSGIAHGRNVTIRDHLSADPTPVMSSTNTAGRIVTNLLSNALKFTPPGGIVDITTASDGKTATLIVDDSGAGISDIDLPHVFERFFRSDDAHKRLTPGTGLGLSIVRSLVQSHGGDISISRSPLGGARMVVTLPAAVDDTPRNTDGAAEN